MLGLMMREPLSIGSLIDHAARFHGDTEIVSVETDGSVSRSNWAEVGRNARRLGDALARLGLDRSTRCGTIAWNNRRHLEIYFGVSSPGFVCHTINPRLFPDQIIYVAAHAEDKVLFFDKTFVPLVASLRDRLDGVRHFVLMGGRDEEALESIPGLEFYDELLSGGDPDFAWPEIDELEASSLCYTSGTTGNPKGVLYSHRSTVLHSFAVCMPDILGLSARDTVLPVVPMFHVNAWGIPYGAAMAGSRMALPGPGLDGRSLVELIDRERVTTAAGVPTIWFGLLEAADGGETRLESLERTVVGGAACPGSLIEAFRDRYGVDVLHGWGMTEISPIGVVNQPLRKHSALSEERRRALRRKQGRPPYGIDMSIAGEDGARLPEDGVAEGELRVRGHWVMSRYHGSDGDGDLVDGWFPTGDVARIDPDGYLDIRDRSKDMIKSGGEWISSVELENIAIAHPGLADAAAIGAKHPKWQERPVLVAVKAGDGDLSEEAVLEFFAGKVAKWQVPERVIFVDELPRNATGKVRKNLLRETHGDALAAEPGRSA